MPTTSQPLCMKRLIKWRLQIYYKRTLNTLMGKHPCRFMQHRNTLVSSHRQTGTIERIEDFFTPESLRETNDHAIKNSNIFSATLQKSCVPATTRRRRCACGPKAFLESREWFRHCYQATTRRAPRPLFFNASSLRSLCQFALQLRQ